MSTSYAELEIGLHHLQGATYHVELRFSDPDPENAAEVSPERGTFTLDRAALLERQLAPQAYGEALATQLFQDDRVRAGYASVRDAVAARELELRVRLLIGPTAHELQALRWELLADPRTKAPLATSERTPFSRFLLSADLRPIRLRPKARLKAIVAVSAPSNCAEYKLAEVHLDDEIDRARKSLEEIDVGVVGRAEPLTVGNLLQRLRDEAVDVLYLICHGKIVRTAPHLFLQGEDGKGKWVEGETLARGLAELRQVPRLAVLASCESAGKENAFEASREPAAQSSMAPRLADAGVPAILAMQGKISMETVAQAMPVFFRELLRDGQIDRALAVARAEVRERADSWMPALFLRLKQGRIWYQPGFAAGDDEFQGWASITSSVRRGEFVPVLGPDVGEHLWSTTRELAGSLAEEHGFPLAPHQRFDLAKVSQYLSVRHSWKFAHTSLLQQLKKQILARHGDLAVKAGKLTDLFKALHRSRCQAEDEAFHILARLGAPVYVTAGFDPVLALALAKAGVRPKLLYGNWRKTRDNHPREPVYEGKAHSAAPAVHHVFGFLAQEESQVLTEDDYVDYAIAAAAYKLTPREVKGTLVRSSLIFLGFPLDDLAFRVLFRLIMSLEGSSKLRKNNHVGVQVDPEEYSPADVRQAREYLKSYLGETRIHVYWGTVTDFLNELRTELARPADDDVASGADEGDEDEWIVD